MHLFNLSLRLRWISNLPSFCTYVDKVEAGKCCEECGGQIPVSDGAFACVCCGVCLHRSCVGICICICLMGLRSTDFNSNNYEKSIQKEACWTISNITAGNKEQIQAVIEANNIAPLVHLLQNAEFDIKRQAAWAISNVTYRGTHDQIRFLVSQGCIKPLCDLLICSDPMIVKVCLQGLENILKVGEADKTMSTAGGVNLYAQMIGDARGREKIEYLWSVYENHDIDGVYAKAMEVLNTLNPGQAYGPPVSAPSSVLDGVEGAVPSVQGHVPVLATQ